MNSLNQFIDEQEQALFQQKEEAHSMLHKIDGALAMIKVVRDQLMKDNNNYATPSPK